MVSIVRAVLVPVGLVTAYFVVPFDGKHWPFGVALGVLAAVATLPLALRDIARIRSSDRPVIDALRAVAVIASLVIVAFSISYYVLATATDQFPDIHTKIDALYFTIVTTGTVGYGDIAPAGQGARALVSLHVVLNLTLIGAVLRVVTRAAGLRHDERNA